MIIIKAGKKNINSTRKITFSSFIFFCYYLSNLTSPTMVDAMVSDLVDQLVSIITEQAKEEIKLIVDVDVDEEVQELKHKLRIIQAMLDNEEERQLKQHVESPWLARLKDAYYKMDDVLDSWNTAGIKSEIEKEEGKSADSNATPAVKKRKVCSFLSYPYRYFRQAYNNLALRRDIGHKIQKLNETLHKIVEVYGFDLTRQLEVVPVYRPKTTCFVEVSDIIGRDNYKNDLLSNLLGEGSSKERKHRVISLVGMGGIGKSTLAQLAYNHSEVQAHFEKMMWVCVSDPFDQCRVAKAIIEEIDPKSLNNITELQGLLRTISGLIKDKKFFLVLDDVWTEDSSEWEPFRDALQCGAQGSRILVTTRKLGVATKMESAPINLEVLSEEDCWLMFSKIAFSNEDQCEDLGDLGRQLADKCKGLPLAVKTLGSLMRKKTKREEWKNILGSSLWELEDVERGVFAPLFLSYYDLPSPMKRCFSYCAIFPKDYIFYKNELVVQWMAQGYIDSKEKNMEMKAEEYFEVLAMCSFFQDFGKDENDGRIVSCKMHDIVHDFARSMTKNECFIIDGDKESRIDLKSARHLHLKISEESKFPEYVYEAKNLRTLFLTSGQSDHYFDMLLSNLFKRFRYLRALYLDCRIKKLPDTVENLIHLRCLLMSESVYIEELPETVCNLCNLQRLRFDGRGLEKFPHGMGKLINLRYLNTSQYDDNWHGVPNPYLLNWQNVIFPKGIGKLTCLKTLRDFYICGKDEREERKLGELKNLDELRVLRINGLRNVVDVSEAENAQLKKKIYLRHLILQFADVFDQGDERVVMNGVLTLNALEPHLDLEILEILWYLGPIVYPNWMMSLTKLKILTLAGFPELESLPPLGKLPSLERLQIWRANYKLKKVGVEFLGIESKNKKDDIIFPRLKSLRFALLDNLEEWIGFEGMREEEDNGITKIMPRLQQLQIENCEKLKCLPDFLRTTPLKELEMVYCSILIKRCRREGGEEWPKISHIPNIKITGKYVQRDGLTPSDCIQSEDGYILS